MIYLFKKKDDFKFKIILLYPLEFVLFLVVFFVVGFFTDVLVVVVVVLGTVTELFDPLVELFTLIEKFPDH